MARPAYEKGISWVELAVVLLIYSIVLAVLMSRLLYYQELAEKTATEYTAIVLRSALREKMAELIIENREIAIPGLAAHNPVTWLESPPGNYCGEVSVDPGPDMPVGCWYFDKGGRTMTYLVNNGDHFLPDSAGRKRIRYRLILMQDGQVTPSVDMKLIEPYRWFE
jgi:competence protein ComGC